MVAPLIYYTATANKQEAVRLMNKALPFLPEAVRKGILRYTYDEDRILTFSGKLLLLQVLKDLGLDHRISLADLQYTSFSRPWFNYPVDFNITHSGNYTLLAFTQNGKIGVDIEIIKPLGMEDYSNVFSNREWSALQENNDIGLFYWLWARKEAVVKAIGKGLSMPLCEIDVTDDLISIDNEQLQLVSIDIDKGYAAAVALIGATSVPAPPRFIGLEACIASCFPD